MPSGGPSPQSRAAGSLPDLPDLPDPAPSLAELAVLGVVAGGPLHGFAAARLLSRDGDVGRVYAVARPAVYRAIERLIDARLIEPLDVEPGNRGPRRTPLRLTPAGRRVHESWLWTPVRHVREIRTEFLAKVVFIDRAGGDPSPLIRAQIDVLGPVVEAIAQHYQGSTGSERTVSLWRIRSAEAALQFLHELAADRSPDPSPERATTGE